MSTFEAPNREGLFRQVNQGDTLGELWSTFNIDLSTSYGKLKTSKCLSPTLSEAKMDNDDIQAMGVFDGYYYAFGTGGRRMYLSSVRNPRNSGAWVSNSISPFDTGSETDAVVFDGKLLVSTGTDIASFDDITGSPDVDYWTNVLSGDDLTVNVPHIMNVSRLREETLFVTDGNKVRYFQKPDEHSTIYLATHLTACCIASDAYATWVGTYSGEGNAMVYEIYEDETATVFDPGSSAVANIPVARRSYPINGSAVLSMDIVDGVPYIVTDKGHIQTLNGRSFVTVAEFPFAMDGVSLAGLTLGNIDEDNTVRAIHPKGMRADNRSLFININTDNQLITDLAGNPIDDDDIFENVVVNPRSSSGIWEYNLDTGILNHRYAFTNADTQNGFHRHQSSGPLLITKNQYTRILAASRLQSGRTDIYAEDPNGTPFGYFITREINSETIQDGWEKLAIKKDVLNNETIDVKYRTNKKTKIPKYNEANWTGAKTFVVEEVIDDTAEVGFLVEIVDGYGAGKLSHITEISTSATTTSITVEDEIGSNGESGYIRIWNFKKFNMDDFEQHQTGGLSEATEWVQFMVVLNGMVEVRQMFNKGSAKTTL